MKYQVNDIVIIKTHDAFRGTVHVPAIITGIDGEHLAYETRVLFPLKSERVGIFALWTVGEDEIASVHGQASVEK